VSGDYEADVKMPIEIQQFEELEDRGRLASWYAEGHHDPDDFASALVEFILEYGDDVIPRIEFDEIRQCYMGKSDQYDGSWEARFSNDPRSNYAPVTVFNDEKRRGGRACPIRGCKAIPRGSHPLSVGLVKELGSKEGVRGHPSSSRGSTQVKGSFK